MKTLNSRVNEANSLISKSINRRVYAYTRSLSVSEFKSSLNSMNR